MKTALDRAKRGRFSTRGYTAELYYTNYACPFCGSPLNLSEISHRDVADCPCCKKHIEIHS